MQSTLVPTSIEWYNPEGALVSKDDDDAVNQASSSNLSTPLTFRRYRERQGGRYECRVAGPGDTLEKLPVCIGETQMDNHKCKNIICSYLPNPQAVVIEVLHHNYVNALVYNVCEVLYITKGTILLVFFHL